MTYVKPANLNQNETKKVAHCKINNEYKQVHLSNGQCQTLNHSSDLTMQRYHYLLSSGFF